MRLTKTEREEEQSQEREWRGKTAMTKTLRGKRKIRVFCISGYGQKRKGLFNQRQRGNIFNHSLFLLSDQYGTL